MRLGWLARAAFVFGAVSSRLSAFSFLPRSANLAIACGSLFVPLYFS